MIWALEFCLQDSSFISLQLSSIYVLLCVHDNAIEKKAPWRNG